MIYVVYLTMYSGTLLPKWYIGSTNIDKLNNGYTGSVASKKWKVIYNNEIKDNNHLFKTRILSKHHTREEALTEELRLHEMHKVKSNTRYFNEAYAVIDGMFGRDVSGENNPNYGKKASEETKRKQSEAAMNRNLIECPHCGKQSTTPNLMTRWHFDNCKSLKSQKIYKCDICGFETVNKTNITRYHNDKCKDNNYLAQILTCPHCSKQSSSQGNMSRWHFDNCKHKLKETK